MSEGGKEIAAFDVVQTLRVATECCCNAARCGAPLVVVNGMICSNSNAAVLAGSDDAGL